MALGIHPDGGVGPDDALGVAVVVAVGITVVLSAGRGAGAVLGIGEAGCSGDLGLSDEVEGERHGSIGGCDMAPL